MQYRNGQRLPLEDLTARLSVNPRARRLSIPWSGHIFNGLSGVDTCYDPLAVKFLETADPVAVDATCLADMQPPPFVTTP